MMQMKMNTRKCNRGDKQNHIKEEVSNRTGRMKAILPYKPSRQANKDASKCAWNDERLSVNRKIIALQPTQIKQEN